MSIKHSNTILESRLSTTTPSEPHLYNHANIHLLYFPNHLAAQLTPPQQTTTENQHDITMTQSSHHHHNISNETPTGKPTPQGRLATPIITLHHQDGDWKFERVVLEACEYFMKIFVPFFLLPYSNTRMKFQLLYLIYTNVFFCSR